MSVVFPEYLCYYMNSDNKNHFLGVVKMSSGYQKINLKQLVGILLSLRGHCFLQLFATTPVRMNKGGRNHDNYLYGNVLCENQVNGSVEFEYENAVNNALVRQGEAPEFEAKDRTWGKHLRIGDSISRAIIIHEKAGETRYYVQLRLNTDPKQRKTPNYIYADTKRPLSDTDLETMYRYKVKKPESLVEVRDYRVDNVDKIHINGEKYELVKS